MNKTRLEQKILNFWYPDSNSDCTQYSHHSNFNSDLNRSKISKVDLKSNSNLKNSNKFIQKLLYKIYLVLTSIPSFIYKLISGLRRYLYKIKVFKSFRPKLPVIVVGNISVGGTGKTPVVIALAEILVSHGFKPGIIIRGYNKSQNSFNKSDSTSKLNSEYKSLLVNDATGVDSIGDEAKVIYDRLKLPVAVGSNRVDSVKLLMEQTDCNIIISDDGMQHYKLERDLEICVVDNIRKFGNNKLLPAGPLREGIKRLKSSDYILAKDTSCEKSQQFLYESWLNKYSSYVNNNIFNLQVRPICFIDVFNNKHIDIKEFVDYILLVSNTDNNTDRNTLRNTPRNIYAISGIGNNKSFFNSLACLGLSDINAIDVIELPDHYDYSNIDYTNKLLKLNSSQQKNIIITTEKDAVKLRDIKDKLDGLVEIYYLKVELKLNANFENNIMPRIYEICNNYKIKQGAVC